MESKNKYTCNRYRIHEFAGNIFISFEHYKVGEVDYRKYGSKLQLPVLIKRGNQTLGYNQMTSSRFHLYR